MKRLALSIVLVCFAIISVHAQITIGKTSEDKPELMDEKGLEQTLTHYDSLKNICEENIIYLKGQTLFVYGTETQKSMGFYDVFYTYKQGYHTPGSGTYKPQPGHKGYTSFEAVAGKYYFIKEVFSEKPRYNLLVEDIETKENIYMYFYGDYNYKYAGYLILGYYEKLKQMYVGKTFETLGDDTFSKYNSNSKLNVTGGTLFECSDIAVNIGESLYAVLTNKDLGSICSKIKRDGTMEGVVEITVSEVNTEITPPYDSLRNICADNITSLKGQTLLVYGNKSQKKDGFVDFYTTRHTENAGGSGVHYVEGRRYGVPCTPFEAVAGKYYFIKDVFLNQIKDSQEPECNLLLEDIESGESLYFYSGPNTRYDGYLILGFLEKQKELYVGKNFKVLENTTLKEYGSNKDLKVSEGALFKCSDLTVDNGEYDAIKAVLTNANVGTVCVPIRREGIVSKLMGVDKYNSLVKRYGESNAKSIARRIKREGEMKEQTVIELWGSLVKKFGEFNARFIIEKRVNTGMTEEMVIESWGKPDHINTTSGSFGVHEQWIYDSVVSLEYNKYLYFENGRLTTIQY